jgi:hypothetical protein
MLKRQASMTVLQAQDLPTPHRLGAPATGLEALTKPSRMKLQRHVAGEPVYAIPQLTGS